LGGETVKHARDREMKRVVEFVDWLEKGRFPFEEITGGLEEIGEETEKCSPVGRRGEESGKRGKTRRIESKYNNAGKR
jgi:hypothetical protein